MKVHEPSNRNRDSPKQEGCVYRISDVAAYRELTHAVRAAIPRPAAPARRALLEVYRRTGELDYQQRKCRRDTMNTCIRKEFQLMATSIRLSPELGDRLDRLAAKTGRTKAYYLRQIIENGIAEMEDYYLASDTLERIRKGQEKVYSSAAVRKDLGLDD
ncbi:MAG: ribbon-helix-helix protein, CopG family [Terracidiphilus sp.]